MKRLRNLENKLQIAVIDIWSKQKLVKSIHYRQKHFITPNVGILVSKLYWALKKSAKSKCRNVVGD